MKSRFRITLLVAVLINCGALAQAATLAVPSQYPTLERGLAAAGPGDIVEISPGSYAVHDLIVPAGVTIAGLGTVPQDVVLDGGGQGRILLLESLVDTVTIRNITFVGGRAQGLSSYDGSGGALLISNSNARVEQCVFTGNAADSHGGAVRCTNSSPMIVSCEFYDNTATEGGGAVDLSFGSSPLIIDSTFQDNRADWGGAMSCRGGSSPRVESGNFISNMSDGDHGLGGAVFADGLSHPDLLDSMIADNQARFGGGLASWTDGSINLDYCTVVNNRGLVLEGGILVKDSSPLITGTIVAVNEGRGISVSGTSFPQITCTNVFGNSAGDWGSGLEEMLFEDGNLSVDPEFCSLQEFSENRFQLSPSSSLILDPGPCGVLGAAPVACDNGASPVEIPTVSDAIAQVTAAPNPFNPRTVISFELARAQDVRVSLYGLDGKLIKTLGEGPHGVGSHEMVWTGRDQGGRQVASGMYFVIIKGQRDTQKLKITLLK